jgi:predicted component of type VI protein secretion system
MMPTLVEQSIQHYEPRIMDIANRELSAAPDAPADLEATTATDTAASSNGEEARSHEAELVE